MAGRFDIQTEATHALVRLTMSGFFEPAEIGQLAAGMAAAVASLRCQPHAHITLVDIRDMAIQSQAAVDHFTNLVGSEKVRSRLLAFVTTRSLARHQATRLTDRPGVKFFECIDAAEQWLGLRGTVPLLHRA